MKVKYIHLKPTRKNVLSTPPDKRRKSPYIVLTFEDGSTRTIKVPFCNLQTDPHHALETASEVYQKLRRDLADGTFNLSDYFPEYRSLTLIDFFKGKLDSETGKRKGGYFDFRENEVNRGSLSTHTFRADQDAARQICRFLGENTQLSTVDERQINRMVDLMLNAKTERTKQPFSRHSINIYLRTLSSAFSYALKAGMIQSNPFSNVKQLKTKKVPRHLSDEEIETLREYLKRKPLWQQHAFEFLLATGVRADELFNARIDNLKTELIHGIPAHFIRIVGKGDRARWVPCDDVIELIAWRQQLCENEKELREYLNGIHGVVLEKVFERIASKNLFFEISSYYSVAQFVLRARRDCKLSEEISPHSFRHTFAVRFLEDGGDIYTLSQILGHASVSTTEIYLSATPKILRMRGKI